MESKYDFIIIGLGISGIHMAKHLESLNKRYLILEKSRNTGGRFAYRKYGDYFFNFGAPSFEWDQVAFKKEIQQGLDSNKLRLEGDILFPVTSFNDWTKDLATGLKIKRSRVDSVSKADTYSLTLESGEIIKTDNLISTAPAEQSYDLFNKFEGIEHLLKASYEKHMYYMFSHEKENVKDQDLLILSKEKSQGLFYYFCHIKQEWSEKPRETLREDFDRKISPKDSFAHKWKYAKIKKTIDLFKPSSHGLYLVGDYFKRGGVLGSYDSCKFIKDFLS